MGIGALAYTVSFLFFAVAKTHFSYWALFFPGLTFMVVGADFEFNVTNMYVMSTMPRSEQSVASGLFQTVTRLCMTIGFGISTAAFNAVQAHPSDSGYYAGDPIEPYAAAFWFSFTSAAASLLLLPWVTVGTQGHCVEDRSHGGKDDESGDASPTESLVPERKGKEVG